MQNAFEGFDSILGRYDKKPLEVECFHYGELFTLDTGKSIIVTNTGKKFFEENPEIFHETFRESAEYEKKRSLLASGFGGSVYKVSHEKYVFAEKKYSWRENGIAQIQDLAKVSFLMKDIKGVRTPKTYYASKDKLLMEFIEAPTWERMVQENPKMEEVLKKSFSRSGGMKRLIRSGIYVKDDSTFVNMNKETGEYEFILSDPHAKRLLP
jgi:hypothetical protein